MNRRGYVLATRDTQIDHLVEQLHEGLGEEVSTMIRTHANIKSPTYQLPKSPDWECAPSGVDILRSKDLIKALYPSYGHDVQTLIHIRRGGDISGQ